MASGCQRRAALASPKAEKRAKEERVLSTAQTHLAESEILQRRHAASTLLCRQFGVDYQRADRMIDYIIKVVQRMAALFQIPVATSFVARKLVLALSCGEFIPGEPV